MSIQNQIMRHIFLFIFLITAVSGNAQTQISGKVTDQKGQSIPGVNVYIKGTFDGSTTDLNGKFTFKTTSSDSLVLIASFIGYQNYEKYLSGQTQDIVCQLKEKVNELNAVTITAGTIDVSDEAKSMVMKPLDIVTTAGALADITGALTTLPGAVKVGNDGRLFVRGGDASETAIYFDGLRVANAYGEILEGYTTDPVKLINGALFTVDYDEMVVVKDIEFFSLCEHHLLPFFGRAHVAYLPRNKVIGLSKIPRIVDMFAHRLQVQERMTQQIAQFIQETINPLGVGVVIEAQHLCMMMRGIKKEQASMTTSSMLGGFRTRLETRMEFLNMIQR